MIPRKHTYHFVFLLFCLHTSILVKGQGTCSSSALAPVFSQTFGQSGSSSSRSTVPGGFTTNYSFQNSGNLNDGYYIVTPRVQNAGRNDWAVGTDHTGNSNGNMFLVNAGTGGSVFFSQQVDNLCPGSTYNFSAWLANVNTNSLTLPICGGGYVYPNVTFNIKNTSGTILASYSTGNLPLTASTLVAPNWQQYGFSFALPSGTTSLVLEMVDAYGGLPQCGNDLAIDDILFTACTPSTTVSFSTTNAICTGSNTSINASIINSPFTTPAYQWQKSIDGGNTWVNIGTPGNNAATYNLNNVSSADQASYRVLVGPDVASLGSSTCITASAPVSLTVYASPTASAGSNNPVCSGSSINLSSIVIGGTSPYTYSWTGPNSFNSTVAYPSITNSVLANGGVYQFQVTDNNGCKANASTNVIVNEKPVVDPIVGDPKGCVGTSLNLSNNTPNGTWSSINTSVATVDQNGVVTFLGAGSSFITYRVIENSCTTAVIKPVTVASVAIAQDVIECNNGVRSYSSNSSDPYYVGYSNTNVGNSYLWTITNTGTGLVENTVYKSGTNQNSIYPSVQLPNGNVYKINIQFTTNGITCSAEHTVYKQIQLTGSITSAQDTTICANATNIPLMASTSVVANSLNWRTLNGSGIFSSTNTLITSYTPSAADIASGTIFIVFEAATTLNMNGNCGSSMVSDTMALHILPANTGINTLSTICSGGLFQYTPTSSIAGSSFIWTSLVLSGTGSGNGTNGSGVIQNTLVNLSGTLDFIVRYTITPIYNGCNGTPFTVTVTVKPLPIINITNNATEICSGGISSIAFNSSISNTQYTWTSDILAGTATGASSNNIASTTHTIADVINNTNTANAIIRYNITGTSSSGCTNTASTNLTVYASPGSADGGPDQQLCNTTVTTLNAVAPAAGSGTWSMVSGPTTISFADIHQANTAITGLTTGTYIVKWTVSNGVCATDEDLVTIIVNTPTVAGILSADATVCAPINNGILSIAGYTGNIVNWQQSTDNGNSWNNINITNATYHFSNLTGTSLFRVLVKNGNCVTETSNTVVLTVLQSPGTANAGNDQLLNGVSATTLSANPPTAGSGSWTQISGPGAAVFSNVNAYNATITGLTTGSYTFRWTITNGSCGSSSDDVSITIEPSTVAGILSADAIVCAAGGNGATLQLSGYTGSIIRWEYSTDNGANWNILSNTADTYTYANLTVTTWYRVLVQSGIGTPAYSALAIITVLQPVTMANAGVDLNLCNQSSTGLLANIPVSGNGSWSWVSGPSAVIFADPTQHNTIISGLTTGSYTFKWNITNGTCPSSEDFVQINVSAATDPGILSADTSVCASGNHGTLVLTGFSGSIIHSEFSTDNGLSWNILNNSTGLSSINYHNLSTTTQYRTLVQNGTCNASYSNIVTIMVLSPVSMANAGTDTTICGAVSAILNANQPVTGMGIWTQITGPNHANFTQANTYNSTVNGLIPGTYTFRWSISNGVCVTSHDDVTLQVTAPLANMITNKTYTVCEGQSVTILAGPASGGNGIYQYQWQETKDGINWTDIPGANSIQYIFTPSVTTTSLRRLVQANPCSQISNVVMVTMQAAVSNNHLPAITYVCKDSSILITGSQPSGGDGLYIYRWQSSIDNGSSWATITGATAKDYTTGFISTNTLFRRIVSTVHCTGVQESISNISSVVIKFNPTAAYSVLPDSGCSPVMMHFTNQSTGNNVVYRYSFGDGKDTVLNTLSAISHLYNSYTLVTLHTSLYATNECGTDSAAKPVIIKPDHIQPDLKLSDSSLCGIGSIVFTNNTKGALKYSWNFGDGSQVIQTSSNSTITHTYTLPGTYLFTLTADNECSIQTIQHTIRIHPAPVAAFTIPKPDFCVGDSVHLSNQSIHASEYRWLLGNSDSSKGIAPVIVYKNEGIFNITLIAGNIYPEDNKSCFDTTKSSISILGSRKGNMQINSLSANCLPHSVEAISLNTPVSEVTWNWGNDSSSKGEKASYQYFTNGQYQITMTAINAGGCRFIDSTTINVNSPSGTFTIADKDICIGQTASFTLNIVNNAVHPQDSIRWHLGDGSIQTKAVANFSYQYTKAGVFYPKAWLLKAGGCLIPLTTTDSVRVDQVISKFGLSGVFECGTTTYQFVDSSEAIFGIRSWKWLMNGKDSSYERIRVSRFNQKGTHTTTLIVEGNTGCIATSQANFDVQVYQYPVASISAMAEACKTDLLELKSTITSQDSVALRLWTLGNGFSAQDSVIKATFANDGTYNIKLTVATVNNCFDSVYKQVTVHPLPKISVQQNNIVCRGDSITIHANGASRFIWKDQQENIICTDCAEIKVKPGSSTSYKVIGYNQFGCSEIKSTSVRVINPIKMIASSGDTLCAGESSLLSATGAAIYQWLPTGSFNGSNTSSINVRPSETTIYKVVGKDTYNCFSDTAEIKVVVGKPTPVTLGKDTTLVSGSSYQLRLQSSANDIVKWRWSGAPGISCVTCPTPFVKLSDDACISCVAVNQFGCISSDTICIKTFCPATEVFVPNAFTPDGDGINDKLIVQGKGIRLIKSFRIFNRWGEVVFEKVNFNPGDPAYGWDGKIKGNIASPDVYVYICEVICEKGLPSIFKGNTAILK